MTELLDRLSSGDDEAANELFEKLYTELRKLAASTIRRWGTDQTLHPTELVHEAFDKLIRGSTLRKLRDRHGFFAVAAQAMQCLLVDHARKRKSLKRPPKHRQVALDDFVSQFERTEQVDLLALDEVLRELQASNDRLYQIVTLHFFSGLPFKEIASYLDVSTSTVEKDWKFARCWLLDRLDEGT